LHLGMHPWIVVSYSTLLQFLPSFS
jgi:hypothetical protein